MTRTEGMNKNLVIVGEWFALKRNEGTSLIAFMQTAMAAACRSTGCLQLWKGGGGLQHVCSMSQHAAAAQNRPYCSCLQP